MFCPRLEHFARLNQDGTVGKCGHMTSRKGFDSFHEMQSSVWLKKIKTKMEKNNWPDECVRCRQSERNKGESVRTNSIKRHKILHPLRQDYLIVGGVLDNVCNSACQTCNAGLSTKIGSLSSRRYERVDNSSLWDTLPQDRIIEVDVNGGEPTTSKNYKRLLRQLPQNTKIVRMNTNGSRTIDEIEDLLKNRVTVIVTMSLDGVGDVHDYVRWPIKWRDYDKTVDRYKGLVETYSNLHLDMWTTVSCLNVANMQEIMGYAKRKGIAHDWAFLDIPDVLNVRYKNQFTKRGKSFSPHEIAIDEDNQEKLYEFVKRQDSLRGISVHDYFSLVAK
jgi:sulfatase maturation enzyme AslB (radical SAM superfamily)